jgi:hypothetical protein
MALMKRTSAASAASRRRPERGQVSWVSMVLLAILVSAVYLGVVWIPVYLVHYEVKQTVHDYMNRAVKDRDDAKLVKELCQRLAALDEAVEVGEDGRTYRTPTVEVTPDQVTWERDTSASPPMLHVTFEYVRVVKYPWLNREQERVMTVDFTEDIAIPNWGVQR